MLNNIKILDKLGTGKYGIVYLVEYNNNTYSMKIEHILERNLQKNFTSKIYRELDFFNYISTLKLNEQQFFMKLYKYKIIHDCKFIDTIPRYNNKSTYLKSLNQSSLCIIYLLDYLGNITLNNYLTTNNISIKERVSFMMQLIFIILVLYKGGYSHNDLHTYNVMVIKTNSKYFKFDKYKIPFYGHRLVLIDYGKVLHNKYGKYYQINNPEFTVNTITKLFYENQDKYIFNEILMALNNIIFSSNIIYKRSNGIKKIMINHPKFFCDMIKIFGNLQPKYKSLLYFIFENRYSDKTIFKLIHHESYNYDIWMIIDKIVYRFFYYYPKEYIEYFGSSKFYKVDFPEKYFIRFNEATNLKQIIDLCIEILNI